MFKLWESALQWLVDLAPLNTVRGYTLEEDFGQLDAIHLGNISDSLQYSDLGDTIEPPILDETPQSSNLRDPSTFNISVGPSNLNHSSDLKSSSNLRQCGISSPCIPISTRSLVVFGVGIPSFPKTSSSPKISPPLGDVPELSRATTRESSLGTSSRSPDRLYAFKCPSCKHTGICGCILRADSLHSNRKKDFGFCIDTEFEQTYYPSSVLDVSKNPAQDPILLQRYKNDAWQGYRSAPIIGGQLDPTLIPGRRLSADVADSIEHRQTEYPVNSDDMVGLGRYRFAKDASKEEIVDNTIAKLGDLAPLASNLALDRVKVYGYDDITYDHILRQKYEREFPDRSTPFEEQISPDGITIQKGFPKGIAPQRDDGEHLRFHTWVDHNPGLQDWMTTQYRHSGRCPRNNGRSDQETSLPARPQQHPPYARKGRQQQVRFEEEATTNAPVTAQLGTAPVACSVVPSLADREHPLAQMAMAMARRRAKLQQLTIGKEA